jgi:hypothetical protein
MSTITHPTVPQFHHHNYSLRNRVLIVISLIGAGLILLSDMTFFDRTSSLSGFYPDKPRYQWQGYHRAASAALPSN